MQASDSEDRIECDVLVVGGGINGAGIARDAAGRGLSVVLCEQDDLGAHTSSCSSKLIHGGLRYLEYYEFGLVRKALREREVLLKSAPHIMWPLRFVMPHDRGQRPAWLIRAALLLYDRLARREFLPASHALDLRRHAAGAPLKPGFARGFEYSDGWVDDARLVVLAAMDAAEHGARVFTRTACVKLTRSAQHWDARLAGAAGPIQVRARALVNAAGPWAGTLLGKRDTQALRLIKGSHIVVPRLFDHPYAYLFQHPDGRIVFAIPYEGAFTLVGTTDLDYLGDPGQVAISGAEVEYLCALVNHYFERQITARDVRWSYAGVRPLVQEAGASAAALTRDYRLEHDATAAPLLTVLGGKITTFRRLAEEAVDWLAPKLGVAAAPWTAQACLPGGDLFGEHPDARSVLQFDQWLACMQRHYPWLSPALARRYGRAYGSRVEVLLAGCECLDDLGLEIVSGLYAVEAAYLVRHEWALNAEDILWRRSKLGLHAPADAAGVLDAWLAQWFASGASSHPVHADAQQS